MTAPIAAAVRSPFALADGVLAGWHPVDLAAIVASTALERAGVDPDSVDHVWVGCDEPVGAQGANVARAVVLAAGWPETIGAAVVDAAPHSGHSALAAAVDAMQSGRVRTAVVVGMSSASMVQPGAAALGRQYGRPWGDAPAERYADTGGLLPPIVAADNAALALGLDQDAQDRFAHRVIAGAPAVPHPGIVAVGARPGDSVAVQRGTPVDCDVIRTVADELTPMFGDDGTTSAAGFAPPADGVSVIVLARDAEPLGEILAVQMGADAPHTVAAPAMAVMTQSRDDPAVMTQSRDDPGSSVAVAAASASMVLAVCAELGLDPDAIDATALGTGDAAAAGDLRGIVDGLHGSAPGIVGAALRVGAGAAAACWWRRL